MAAQARVSARSNTDQTFGNRGPAKANTMCIYSSKIEVIFNRQVDAEQELNIRGLALPLRLSQS